MRVSCKTDLPAISTARQTDDNWPLVLTRGEGAKMCQISVQSFDTWVRKGILPGPIAGTRRWSREAIKRRLADQAVVPSATDQSSPFEQWKRHSAN
jgi:hypothetical protein